MDLICDDVVEEILLRLPLKYLHRLGAVSRRYNALVLRPGFATRYWQSHGPHLSGVFLQSETLIRPWGPRPCFLTAPPPAGRRPAATESVLASDLGFMPRMQTGFSEHEEMIFIVHSSSSGLLLCSRGSERQAHYYVCNPVTWQCVALPELPGPHGHHSGLLTLATDGHGNTIFLVVLVNHPSRWQQGLCLKVFCSGTGEWRQHQFASPSLYVDACSPPYLGPSGNAYWIGFGRKDRAIAFNSFYGSTNVLTVPTRATEDARNRCLGELHGGGLRYAHFDMSVFEVWDLLAGGGNVMWYLVHRIDVMELAMANPEATSVVLDRMRVCMEGLVNLIKHNDLFTVIGFHPTDYNIVYFDAGSSVAAYSMDRRAITLQNPRQCFASGVFPYVHPPYPILIPEIKKPAPSSELKQS